MEQSDVTYIDIKSSNPMDLFKFWYSENAKFGNPAITLPAAFCISTVDSSGNVHSRNLLMRELIDDRIWIMTDRRSNKCKDLSQNSSVAGTFMWVIEKNGTQIWRQVRIEGTASELSTEQTKTMYDKESLYCKIRAHICHQDLRQEWQVLKNKHDQIFEEYKNGEKELPMPDHVVGYEIAPKMMEFYESESNKIADRVLFELKWGKWENCHVTA